MVPQSHFSISAFQLLQSTLNSQTIKHPCPRHGLSSRVDEANGLNHLVNMSVVANQVEIGDLISRTPGIKSGTPHIAGTGVTVRTIVRYYKLGMSPEEIAAEYPHLSLAQVYGALAYYHANRDEMDLHMAAEERSEERIEQEHLQRQKSGA